MAMGMAQDQLAADHEAHRVKGPMELAAHAGMGCLVIR
jgi:hypothetical protein